MRIVSLVAVMSLLLSACTGSVRDNAPPKMIGSDVWSSSNFRNSHPDLLHRLGGQAAFEDGDFATARVEFEVAARFGDKLSQAMLAEMEWLGTGAPANRARAYVWMDLAAERGFVGFVSKRERFWAALDQTERGLVRLIGEPIYAEYGDESALPRLGIKFRRGLYGSVLRKGGSLAARGTVLVPNGGPITLRANGAGGTFVTGGIQMEFADYYDDAFWRVDSYVRWHEEQLDLARRGTVEVGQITEPERHSGHPR